MFRACLTILLRLMPAFSLFLIWRLLKGAFCITVVFSFENYTCCALTARMLPLSHQVTLGSLALIKQLQKTLHTAGYPGCVTWHSSWLKHCWAADMTEGLWGPAGSIHHWQSVPWAPTQSMSNTCLRAVRTMESLLWDALKLWRHDGVLQSVVLPLLEQLMLVKSSGLKKGGIRS